MRSPEEYRSVPSFPRYQVSSSGKVFSEVRQSELLTIKEQRGKPYVIISKNGKTLRVPVHLLIAEAFKRTKNPRHRKVK